MKQNIELSVETRNSGKANSRALRNERKVPAVIYGSIDPLNVCLNENDVKKYNTRAYENALFTLKSAVKETEGKIVLIKSVDVHPVTRRPQHVDLFALDLKKPVRLNVEVRLEGKPAGLAEGGVLNVVHRSIEIECLPTGIPEFFTADISALVVGDSLHASDIKLSEGVRLITKPEETIVGVVMSEDEIVAAPVAAAAPAAAPAKGGGKAPAGKAPAAKAPAGKAPAAKAPGKK